MDQLIENLVKIGLKEYEAKIYVSLVGLGEANVRRIHEVSGVPRPRVYDVLNALAVKGFINIRQGSPLMYSAVPPDSVVTFLKKDLDTAARESLDALENSSLVAQQSYSPIWYVHSDWTIQKNLEILVESVRQELVVLCINPDALRKFKGPITSITRNRTVKVVFPKGSAENIPLFDGVALYEAGTLRNFFGINIFERVFTTPIDREGTTFYLECILIADDRESMLIYRQNEKRMAVMITLPFITCVQSQLFHQMIARGHEVLPKAHTLTKATKKGRKPKHRGRKE